MPESGGSLYFDLHLKIEPDSPSASDQELQQRLAVVAYLGGFDANVASSLAQGVADKQKVSEVLARVYLSTIAQRLLLDGQFSVEFLAVQVRPGSVEVFAKIRAAARAAVLVAGTLYQPIEHGVVMIEAADKVIELVEPSASQKHHHDFITMAKDAVQKLDPLIHRKTTVAITQSQHSPAQSKVKGGAAGTHHASITKKSKGSHDRPARGR